MPTGGDTRWLREGEALSVTLTCATGHRGPELRFRVTPLPPGAQLDAGRGVLRWTPARDQAAVWTLTLTEESTGEQSTLRIGVADNWQASGNVPVGDPAAYTEEYGLPVFHLSFPGDLSEDEHRPASLVYRGRTFRLEAKYRGASSAEFPKRSYTLKFDDNDKFDEPEHAGGGFLDRRRLVLVTSFNDNSYLRPRLAFELWNRMSPDHIQVKTYSAVLYVNGRYHGLYTVADHVDKQMMRRHGLNPEGDLFKAVKSDANFSRLDAAGARKASLSMGFEKKEGLPEEGSPGAFTPIEELTAFVADASTAAFRAEWGARMETHDYEDWWILNVLILGTDSASKNAYHYRDPAGGRWRVIPWDLDASFGQAWNTFRETARRRSSFADENRLYQRLVEDPALAVPLNERLRALVAGELRAEVVQGWLDAWAAEIRPSALRDEARWGSAYRSYSRWRSRSDFTTHLEEVDYVRGWIGVHWDLLERGPPSDCPACGSGGSSSSDR